MDITAISWAELVPCAAPLQGGMGIVLRGTWRAARAGAPEYDVAVKVLKAGALAGASQEGAIAVLQHEAAAMRVAGDGGLNAYVVQLYGTAHGAMPAAWVAALGVHAGSCLLPDAASGGSGSGSGSQGFALVMRWEEGGSLHSLLHSPKMTWGAGTAERLLLCEQIASGLRALHFCSSGTLIHGDIKADNVLLSQVPGVGGGMLRPRISDFGFAELRSASQSSVAEAVVKRGTWEYMAPEMYRSSTALPAQASRATDVYALGTLLWEVLSGQKPWANTKDVVDRVLAIRDGKGLLLTSPTLPVDTPTEVRMLLEACLCVERDARPRMDTVADTLHQAAQDMVSGEFDIFLSHAWDANSRHALLTTEVYLRITDMGMRVWLDIKEMGPDPTESMKKGIRSSRCVVALLNERYSKSVNCKRELTWAKEMGKPVVGCLAEPQEGWFLGEELKVLVPPDTHLFADLRVAAGVKWAEGENLAPAQRALLTKEDCALPKVLRLVGQCMRGEGGVGGEVAGTVASACSTSTADLPGSGMTAERVVELMKAGAGDARVAVAGARALVTLTGGEGTRSAREAVLRKIGATYKVRCEECYAAGAAGALVAALKVHTGCAGLVEQACLVLCNLACFPPGQDACVAAEAIPAIVAVLKAHAGVADVAGQACKALLNIGHRSPAHCTAIVVAGAVPQLAFAFSEHSGNTHSYAQSALAMLGYTNSGLELPFIGMSAANVVELMRLGARDERVANVGAHVLAELAKDTLGQEACIAAGVVASIISTLYAYAGKAGVVSNACRLLGRIALINPGKNTCIAAGIVPVIVFVLKAQADNANVAQITFWVLCNIAVDETGQEACVTSGAVPAIALALSAHSSALFVSKYACIALSRISRVSSGLKACGKFLTFVSSGSGQQACLTSNAIPAVTAALTMHNDEADIARAACEVFYRLTLDYTPGAEACVACGAVSAIVDALTENCSNDWIALWACRALRNIAVIDSGEDACVASGAIPVIISAIKEHANVFDIVSEAIWVLASIATRDAGKMECISSDAVSAITEALNSALDSEFFEQDLFEAACTALENLGSTKAGHEACIEAKSLCAIFAAMESDPDGESMVWAPDTLSIISGVHPPHHITDGAVREIIDALTVHNDSAQLVELGCELLADIERIVPQKAAGAIGTIVAALSAHTDADMIVRYACEVLSSISSSGSGAEACAASGAVPAIVAVFKEQANDKWVIERACHALCNIATVDAGREVCLASGACIPVIAALNAHADSAAVAEWACKALSNFASANSGKEACVSFGAIPAIVAVLKVHLSVAEVAESACWALKTIGSSPVHRIAIETAGAVPIMAAALAAHSGEVCTKIKEALEILGYLH